MSPQLKSPGAEREALQLEAPADPEQHRQGQRESTLFPSEGRLALELPHKLELFGTDFQVHLSTRFTLSVQTAALAVLDVSLDSVLRKNEPHFYQALRKLNYITRGQHRPTATTKKLLLEQFSPVLPGDELRRALDGENTPAAPAPEWDLALKGFQHDKGVLADIARCMAACDTHLLEFVLPLTRLRGPEAAEAHLQILFGQEQAVWRALNPRLSIQVFLLLEVAFKALAWLECRMDAGPAGRDMQRSAVDVLLQDGRRPMGNWLQEVCEASDCRNLAQLSQELLRRGAKHHKRPISHELLRKWASPKRSLMPHTAVRPVLAGVRPHSRIDADTLRARYYVARFFEFACDLVRAGTSGEPRLAWKDVQAQVRSRCAEAYRLQATESSA